MNSSDSSFEFWEDRDRPTKDIGISANLEILPQVLSEPNEETKMLLNFPNSYFHNRLDSLLSNLRIGSEIQKEQELEKQSRQLTKLFNTQVQELVKKQQSDFLMMKKDYDSLKNLLVQKDSEITQLQQQLIEQEYPITKQRLFKKISRASVLTQSQEKQENNEQELEIKALKLQILGMKELVKMYKEQTEKARKDLKECQNELSITTEEYEGKLNSLSAQGDQEKTQLNTQIQDLNQKYLLFKEEVKKEMEINSIVIKQQLELNQTLKRELKSAKMVLVTPRLREKFINKFPPEHPYIQNDRVKKNLKYKEPTLEYLNSTRASPALPSITDISLQSTSPLSVLPDISSRYLSQ